MSNKSYGLSSEDEDSSSAYTDDFDTDSPPPSVDKHMKFHSSQKVARSKKDSHASTSSAASFQPHKKTSANNSKMKKAYIPKPSGGTLRKTSGANKSPKKNPNVVKPDLVQAQMLSAQKSRINALNNELVELQNKLDELVKENRLLKKVQHRQEKSLQKFENKDADIPRLISNYEEELRVLRMRLRKSQEAERSLESKLRDSHDEFQKSENNVHRLKRLVDDKNLGERSDLFRQLNAAQDRLYDSNKKNSELEKKLDLTIQSFTRQVNGEKSKHVETKDKLKEMQHKNDFLESRLKEKERALQVSNIYALRAKPAGDKSPVSSGHVSGRKSTKKHNREIPSKTTSPACPPLDSPVNDPIDDTSRDDYRLRGENPKNVDSPTTSPRSDDASRIHFNAISGDRDLEAISNGLNDFNLRKEAEASIKKDDGKDPTSVIISSKSTSSSKSGSSSNCSSAGSTKDQSGYIREKSFTIHSKSVKVSTTDKEKQIEEERKKAALLAKIKDLDASDSSPNPTPEKQQIRKLLKDDSISHNSYTRQAHAMKPSYEAGDVVSGFSSNINLISKQPESDETDELTFGGYAPTVTSAPKRKLNPRSTNSHPATPPSLESDEPLLDLNSGKAKSSDLLQQLFGDDFKANVTTNGQMKKESSFTSNRGMLSPKATALVSPLQNGYPWKDTQRNGNHGHPRKDSVLGSPLIKALHSAADDEIEEMML